MNDPFARVWQAFKNLYPDKGCMCRYGVKPKSGNGDETCANTTFPNNPDNKDDVPLVTVYFDYPAEYQIDSLILELARVAVGPMKRYSKRLDETYAEIFAEYNRLGEEQAAQADSGKQETQECA